MPTASETTTVSTPAARLEILAYAPTEFFHCGHCEFVWNQIGFGGRVHAEQRRAGLLPPDLQADYDAISDWVLDALDRYGNRLAVKVVDAASVEGVLKALRYRVRRLPAFVLDGGERIAGFDRGRLDAALTARLGPGSPPRPAPERG